MNFFKKAAAYALLSLLGMGMTTHSVMAQSKKDEKRAKQIASEPFIVLDDTLYVKGKTYALFIKSKQSPMIFDYSLRTLGNVELAYAKAIRIGSDPDAMEYYYEVIFMGSGSKCEIRQNPLLFQKTFLKEIVESNLVSGEAINPDGERRFLLMHGQNVAAEVRKGVDQQAAREAAKDAAKEAAKNGGSTSGGVVAGGGGVADPSKSAFIIGNDIKQGSTVVGKITTSSKAEAGGVVEYIDVTNTSGARVAHAECKGVGGKTLTITTFADHRTHVINAVKINKREDVADYLIKNGYL